ASICQFEHLQDGNCRSHSVLNITVASSSIFPRTTAFNPFTLLCNGIQLQMQAIGTMVSRFSRFRQQHAASPLHQGKGKPSCTINATLQEVSSFGVWMELNITFGDTSPGLIQAFLLIRTSALTRAAAPHRKW